MLGNEFITQDKIGQVSTRTFSMKTGQAGGFKTQKYKLSCKIAETLKHFYWQKKK